MQSLYPANKPCNRCGAKISWDKRHREELETNLPLNLDGTIHTCNEDNEQQNSPSFPQEVVDYTNPARKEGGRQSDIERMHNENIKAMENLTAALNRIAEAMVTKNNTTQ